MAQTLSLFRPRPGKTPLEREKNDLRVGLDQTRTLLNQAYAGFNSTADPDLTESFVFEISALQARYTYLLRQMKALEGGGVT